MPSYHEVMVSRDGDGTFFVADHRYAGLVAEAPTFAILRARLQRKLRPYGVDAFVIKLNPASPPAPNRIPAPRCMLFSGSRRR